jgi:DNA-binding transcriptional LysR family regulator
MRALNPDQLRTFVDVVELGSFTAAARRLNLSQPAVSLQIRELEARCGIQLLDRLGKKPFPTTAGRQLLVHAHRILNENEDALAAMRRIREARGQQVRLGMSMTTLTYVARDTVRHFKRDNPDIELIITLSPSTPLVDDVRSRNIDLAIVSLPIDGAQLNVQVFHEDNVIAILPEGDYSPTPRAATPELLASAPFVVQGMTDVQTRLAQEWFRQGGQAPHSFVEVRNLEACRAAVAAGLGVSIVPGVMAQHSTDGLLVLPLDPPVTRQLALIEYKGRPVNPAIDKVRAALLSCGGATMATRKDDGGAGKIVPVRRTRA